MREQLLKLLLLCSFLLSSTCFASDLRTFHTAVFKEIIDLGNNRTFTKYSQFFEVINNPGIVLNKRKATAHEMLVYGALYQKGITHITYESMSPKEWGKALWSTEPREKTVWIEYRSPNCDEGTVYDSPINFYENDLIIAKNGGEGSGGEGSGSGRLLGGEGSGSGLVVSKINMSATEVENLSLKPNFFERRFKTKPRYYKILTGEKRIPKQMVRVKCRK